MAMVFGDTKRHGPGSDAWFWPPITAQDAGQQLIRGQRACVVV
jgi:hypothetical protein